MAFFDLKLGLDLEMLAAHPHQKFQGVPPPRETILQATEPDELAVFSNELLVEEVRAFCPLWHHCVLGASGLKDNDIKVHGPKTNTAALLNSVVVRATNSTASAAQYRI